MRFEGISCLRIGRLQMGKCLSSASARGSLLRQRLWNPFGAVVARDSDGHWYLTVCG